MQVGFVIDHKWTIAGSLIGASRHLLTKSLEILCFFDPRILMKKLVQDKLCLFSLRIEVSGSPYTLLLSPLFIDESVHFL